MCFVWLDIIDLKLVCMKAQAHTMEPHMSLRGPRMNLMELHKLLMEPRMMEPHMMEDHT